MVRRSQRLQTSKLSVRPQRGKHRISSFTTVPPQEESARADSPVVDNNAAEVLAVEKMADYAPSPYLQFLEFDLLFHTFQYAAWALSEEEGLPNSTCLLGKSSTAWLLQTSRVCKSFAQPALAALYYKPTFASPSQARNLLSHLRSTQPHSPHSLVPLQMYRSWVKEISMPALSILAYKDSGHDPIDIDRLLEVAPMLRGLSFQALGDHPQNKQLAYNNSVKGRSKVYKQSSIEVLDSGGVRLKSFNWNYYFNRDQTWPWCSLLEIHSMAAFGRLEKVQVSWFNVFTKKVNRDKQATSLVNSLNFLPRLKDLTFTISQLDGDVHVLLNLSKPLEHLFIIDCDVDSASLAHYLAKHGHQLRSLTLNHNRSLNLGFLGGLATSCSNLEKLSMNMQYYGLLMSQHYPEPQFKQLLPEGVIPSWPSTLQRIELTYLRRCSQEAAKLLLGTLVDSARSLPYLRVIIIKASVDMDWRARVKLRDEWDRRLGKIFKRQAFALEPRARTITSGYTSDTRAFGPPTAHKRKHSQPELSVPSSGRRSKRLERNASLEVVAGSSVSRLAHVERADQVAGTPNEGDTRLFIQGKCHTVEFRIENLRPAETQYLEKDFLDDEVSGDEDWDGSDSPWDDSYAAYI